MTLTVGAESAARRRALIPKGYDRKRPWGVDYQYTYAPRSRLPTTESATMGVLPVTSADRGLR